MDLKLKGKCALVTGSTSGIGEAIAVALAAEGVAVAINGRDEARGARIVRSIGEAGGRAVLALGDVSTDGGAQGVAAIAIADLGGVDILVNNAGGRASEAGAASFFDVSDEDWHATYGKNVVASIGMMRLLAPAMQARRWGRIVHIASGIAATPTGTMPDYAAAKAAIVNLSLGAAKALANTGITVNTVSPGMIYTPAIESWLRAVGDQQGWGDDQARSEAFVLEHYVRQTVKRLGQVDDIANAVAYLCSPLADFISGADLRIDGGSSPSIN